MTTDPTLGLCPVPTILGINQSAFLWGLGLVAAGLGGWLLLRNKGRRTTSRAATAAAAG
jgi:UPF0716 family protein affecting phage T7 exclusion